MNPKASLTLVLLLTPIVMLSHISWERRENGWMFNVDGRDVDLIGMGSDQWRTATHRCGSVSKLDNANPKYQDIKQLVQSYSPPDSMAIKAMHVWTHKTWAMAEVEFDGLLPAVITIKHVDAQPEIVEDAIWSGMTKPWQSGPFIRAYLSRQSPATPEVLMNCFELQTQSFQ